MWEDKQKLQEAFREAASLEFELIEENAATPEFSDDFLSKMDHIMERAGEPHIRRKRISLRWIACIAVIFLFTGVTVSAVCVDAIRTPILQFLGIETAAPSINSHGFSGDSLVDEDNRPYIIYNGGEMKIPYKITATGMKGKEIGVLMFIDGQIQPYSTASNGTLQYMQIFTAQGYGVSEELIFTPVTGANGDKLMIYFMCIVDPNAYLESESRDCEWMTSHCMYLLYEANPPEAEYPETTDRIIGLSTVTLADADLTSGWTEQDLAARTEFQFYVNGKYYDSITSVDADEPLRLRFTSWGTDQNSYGVVFFINHQPLSIDPEDIVFVSNELGEKVVIEVEVDISDLSGNVLVYAMLATRNKRIDTYSSFGFAVPTRNYFFVCE